MLSNVKFVLLIFVSVVKHAVCMPCLLQLRSFLFIKHFSVAVLVYVIRTLNDVDIRSLALKEKFSDLRHNADGLG